jgi:hypothetical protein
VLVVALAWIIQLARPPTEDLTTQRREEPTIQAREDLTTQPREEPTIQAREEPTTQPREDPIIQPREEQTIPPMGQEKTTTWLLAAIILSLVGKSSRRKRPKLT